MIPSAPTVSPMIVRKPHYRWIESHGAWLLVCSGRTKYALLNPPLWLFPDSDRGRDW